MGEGGRGGVREVEKRSCIGHRRWESRGEMGDQGGARCEHFNFVVHTIYNTKAIRLQYQNLSIYTIHYGI